MVGRVFCCRLPVLVAVAGGQDRGNLGPDQFAHGARHAFAKGAAQFLFHQAVHQGTQGVGLGTGRASFGRRGPNPFADPLIRCQDKPV